jgi:SAM-dependent methyltransferase
MALLSPRLRAFVGQFPEERGSLLAFVSDVASGLPAGTRILDAGAGNAPYRELFAHCDYVTADWANSPHDQAATADILGSLEALPIDDGAFDAVLSTQVLEHVAEPLRVLAEIHRITRPGGRLYLTVPLVGELHEEPHDYFRYTPHGLRHLLSSAGFSVESIRPRNGYFTTLASLARTGTWAIGQSANRPEAELATARRLLLGLTSLLPAFDALDERHVLPLGYECVAVRPEA